MKLTLLARATAFIFALALAQAQTPPPVAVAIPPTTVTRTATIQLGAFPGISEMVFLPRAPTTLVAGTRAQILAPAPGATYGPVQWFMDSTRLAAAGATLDFAAVTAADSGNYTAFMKNADGTTSQSDSVTVFVTGRTAPRVINLSTRARIDATQTYFLSGFVVEPGPSSAFVLVRAVGPALAAFGVKDALAAPQLRLFDARGQEVAPWSFPLIQPILPIPDDPLRGSTGAFPLPAWSKDVTRYFNLSAGAYTAQLSSADGGSGTALLEVYEVP